MGYDYILHIGIGKKVYKILMVNQRVGVTIVFTFLHRIIVNLVYFRKTWHLSRQQKCSMSLFTAVTKNDQY